MSGPDSRGDKSRNGSFERLVSDGVEFVGKVAGQVRKSLQDGNGFDGELLNSVTAFMQSTREQAQKAVDGVGALWKRPELQEIFEGRILLTETQINEGLAQAPMGGSGFSGLQVFAAPDRMLLFTAHSDKIGRIEIEAVITEARHNDKQSCLRFKVTEIRLPDHAAISWVARRLSPATILGKINIPDTNGVLRVDGDMVQLELREVLAGSDLGKHQILGIKLLDLIRISDITTRDGVFVLQASLNLPQQLLATLKKQRDNLAERFKKTE